MARFAATLVAADKDTSRTHVHDDQADYFETSSDVWLTNEERAELDRRRLEKERLEEERRRKVVVSVDLVGRRVVMDDPGAMEKIQGKHNIGSQVIPDSTTPIAVPCYS